MSEVAPLDACENRWSPALRRAVMRVRPEFFAWSRAERERYGAAIPETDRKQIDIFVLKELFGITDERDLTDEQCTQLNEAVLPLTGVGEDCFYLNERLGEDQTILDFETVYDYDHADYLFQEDCRTKETPGYEIMPYRGTLYLRWARLFMDGCFTYATLSTAAGYLFSVLQEHADDTVDELVPHTYVPGKDHGKRETKGYRWDMRLAADGKEGLLDELRHRSMDHLSKKYRQLADTWDARASRGVFIGTRDIPGEANKEFVFTDKTALRAVCFRSFVRDCRTIERPFDELTAEAKGERAKLDTFLHAEHEILLKTFDPKVAKLRKKRTVLIHEDAADKLL